MWLVCSKTSRVRCVVSICSVDSWLSSLRRFWCLHPTRNWISRVDRNRMMGQKSAHRVWWKSNAIFVAKCQLRHRTNTNRYWRSQNLHRRFWFPRFFTRSQKRLEKFVKLRIVYTNVASWPMAFTIPNHGTRDGIGVTTELGIKNSFYRFSPVK